MALADFFNGPKLRQESEQRLDEIKRLSAENARLPQQAEQAERANLSTTSGQRRFVNLSVRSQKRVNS